MSPDSIGRIGFPSTRWSRLKALRNASAHEYRQEMSAFISLYWRPVCAWIRAAWGKGIEEAKDLTQEFFLVLLERQYVGKADRAKGPFRRYLKVLLNHFLVDIERREGAQKRGGNRRILPLDFAQFSGGPEPLDRATPETAFDREWVAAVLREAQTRLEIRLTSSDREKHWEALREFDLAPAAGCPPAYSELAPRVGVTEAQLGRLLFEARREFRALVREVVREYCTSEEEVDEEIGFLLRGADASP